jgi:NAD-dependent dihydropyrimidine dehydrogenase PreA subunit
MTYVITQGCVGKKDASCVSACPVDAIHPAPGEAGYETADQLYIDPTECVDCGACEPQCPHEAIYVDSEVPQEWHDYIEVNSQFFETR